MDAALTLSKRAPMRSACDKCHDIKTKCWRGIGSIDCERCIRLGLAATTRQGLEARRGSKRRSRAASLSEHGSDVSVARPKGPPPVGGDLTSSVGIGERESPPFEPNFGLENETTLLIPVIDKSGPNALPTPATLLPAETWTNPPTPPALRGISPSNGSPDDPRHGFSSGVNFGHESSLEDFGLTSGHLESVFSLADGLYASPKNAIMVDFADAPDNALQTAESLVRYEGAFTSATVGSISNCMRSSCTMKDQQLLPSAGPGLERQIPASIPVDHKLPGTAVSSSTEGDRYEHALYQLSILHLDLYRFATYWVQYKPKDALSGRLPACDKSQSPETRIDEIFEATQTFTDILRHLFPIQSQEGSEQDYHVDTSLPTSVRNDEQPVHSRSYDVLSKQNRASHPDHHRNHTQNPRFPDTATVLLVLACYFRLLHIYESFLSSLHQRLSEVPPFIKTTGLPPTAAVERTQDHRFGHSSRVPPAISVGSFRLLGSSDLNIGLLLHLVAQLLKRVQNLVRACFSESQGGEAAGAAGEDAEAGMLQDFEESDAGAGSLGPSSPMVSAAEAALKQIRERETIVSETLQALNSALIS